MRETITMSVPASVKAQLDDLAKSQNMSRSQIVQQALNRYFQEEEFEALRARLIPKAQSVGIFTDEDVFERFS